MTTQPTATVTLDASTEIIAKPARNGWKVVAVEDGREHPLGRSSVLGARRAIHEVLAHRNRATSRPNTRSGHSRRPAAGPTSVRRRLPVAPLASTAVTVADDQSAAWAALGRAVAQQPRATVKSIPPVSTPQARRKPNRAATTAHATATERSTAPMETVASPATVTPSAAPTPADQGAVWGVHVTLEHLNGDTTTLGTATGEISAALRRALRDALGDRTASRVRKALRRCGLINRPTVFEHEHTSRGLTQRLRIHIAQLDRSAPVDGDVAALICERTRRLPIRRDVALLGA